MVLDRMRLKLGATFVGSTAQVLIDIDPVAPTAGGLLLVEAAHPLGGFPTGVPVNGGVLTNHLRDQAASLLGVSAATLDPVMQVVNMTGSFGKVERTTKGGVHAIQSVTQTTVDQGFQIPCPLPIVTYMKAHPENTFFISVWNQPTRLHPGPGTVLNNYAYIGGPPTDLASVALGLGSIQPQNAQGQLMVGRLNQQRAFHDGANFVNNTKVTGQIAAASLEAAFTGEVNVAGRYDVFNVGNFNHVNRTVTSGRGKQGARVFWRAYMEDLTVSGRSFATVSALDVAEYNKQVVFEGGRYYGDTIPTDPSTIP